jgi:transaldolase/glucose-6-phosphate isomerase
LHPIYDRSDGRDGFVSLEVSPHLAHDTKLTIAEAERLWRAVERENLMIKVPGTREGLPAIENLIATGINVNVTLLFSRERYAEVLDAYLRGLERWLAAGRNPTRLASVASFFVSRIDTAVDQLIDAAINRERDVAQRNALAALKGKVAIANAKLAYQYYRTVCTSARWQKLSARGARVQRLLWASTGTKNKAYAMYFTWRN